MNFVLAKAAVSVAMAPLSLDVVRRRTQPMLEKMPPAAWVAVFAVTRLTAVIAAFWVLGLPTPGDVERYYSHFGRAVLAGARDAASPYSPGFDYLVAGLLWLFRSPLSVVVAFTGCEIAAFALAIAALRRRESPVAAPLAWLWMVSPLSLFSVALGGQDESLILLIWSAAFWAVAANRSLLAGPIVSVGLFCTKILGLFAGLPLLGLPLRKLGRVAAIAGAVGIVIGGALISAGVPVFTFLRESTLVTSGNVWAWIALAGGWDRRSASSWQFAVAAAAILAAIVRTRRRPLVRQEEQALRVTGTVGCLFLLLTPKSFTAYLLMFLPGVLFVAECAGARARAFVLTVFMPVAAFESSLWFSFDQGTSLGATWWARPAMLVADALLIAGYITLAWRGLRLGTRAAGIVNGAFGDGLEKPAVAT